MIDGNLTRLAEASEAASWADLYAAMPDKVISAIQGNATRIGGALSISARAVPLVTFNRAMGLGYLGPVNIPALAHHIAERSAPVANIQIAPEALDNELEQALAAEGYRQSPVVWAKMARQTAPEPQSGGVTVEAVTADTAGAFAATVSAGFGMPPIFNDWLSVIAIRDGWRCYLARVDRAPVAGAAMYLGPDHVWLGIAATLPSARGKGAQKALIRTRLADAHRLGKPWAFTETGVLDGPNPSLANMVACGFELVHNRTNWVRA